MRIAEPIAAPWRASLALGFSLSGKRTVLAKKHFDGPLVVQKPFYPEGDGVCHAIVVHPPGGIAGGDELAIDVATESGAATLLTTPGAAKWYRTRGALARQKLLFEVQGDMEWLPRETIVFDGAAASLESEVRLEGNARFIGWELICLGRGGAGERFRRGRLRMETRISRDGRPLWLERGTIEGDGALADSPAGLGGRTVFGTLLAAAQEFPANLLPACRAIDGLAITCVPGLLLGRYLGDSSEQGMHAFTRLWQVLRPALMNKDALPPRIWST